ncbi:hypothetical protein J2P12_01040 [Candidatus Bathyarchaeota archaeon]|nr:hypothetical protein [Candidatus Bathyarchaeota archaeon]
MKQAAKDAVIKANKTEKALLAKAEETKKKETEVFSPMQAIGQFASNLDKDRKDKILPLWDELLDEFASEGNSKIQIGNTLRKCESVLGDVWSTFLDVIKKTLRRDRSTCYVYIGIADSFNFAFAKNVVVKNALARFWDAKGAFDSTNGKPLPVLDKAIKACGGIPETTDSQTCEVWAQVFVDTLDGMVRGNRKAQVDKTWDSETFKKNHERVVKAFQSFVTNKNVDSRHAVLMLRDILLAAMEPKVMGPANVNAAFTAAQVELSKRKKRTQEMVEKLSEGTVAEARATA